MNDNMPTITLKSVQIPCFRHLATQSYVRHLATQSYVLMADNLNNLRLRPRITSLPLSPIMDRDDSTEDVLSLEVMVYNGKIAYDFAVTDTDKVARQLKRGRAVRKLKEFTMRDALSDYRKSFGDVLADQGSSWLKLNFYVIRLRLDMLLVERLLRDFIKRSKWHISVLSKKDAAYSDKSSHLLLREVANFDRRREGVFKHIDEAIGYYQLKSGSEFFALEKEIFGLRITFPGFRKPGLFCGLV